MPTKALTYSLLLVLTGLSLTSHAPAAPPKNPTFAEYSVILSRSPFKIEKPPIQEETAPIVTSLLSLRGVTQFDDGWVATVIDRKEPNKPIRIHEGKPKNGFTLISVKKSKDDYTKTTVIIKQNGKQMSVGYNTAELKKNLTARAPVPQRTLPRPTTPRTTNTSTAKPQTSTATPQRPSRIRRVPAPTPSK